MSGVVMAILALVFWDVAKTMIAAPRPTSLQVATCAVASAGFVICVVRAVS